jgi:Na+-transporting NADH:ubiquinone oxidoreductase subunit A
VYFSFLSTLFCVILQPLPFKYKKISMANVIKLRKGLDIKLKGKAAEEKSKVKVEGIYALVPDDFIGITPKVIVKEGDNVKAGDILFVNKNHPSVKFSSPVSGIVSAIVRGDRRKVLYVQIDADSEQKYVDFGKKDILKLDGNAVIDVLLEAGLFGYINQLPYAISTNPETKPKAIFVSGFRDKPLAADFEFELKGNEQDFSVGLTALSKIATTYLGLNRNHSSQALTKAKNVEINIFDGPCPAGNVGVQINNVLPVNKGEIVWTVNPSSVIYFGRLFNTGKVDLHHAVAVVGSEVIKPAYSDVIIGKRIGDIIEGNVNSEKHLRIINGNVLTGKKSSVNDFLGAHVSEISVIPEGDDVAEFAGWIMPRLNQYSSSRSYLSWLFGKHKEYSLDARIKGGERHMIMSGEYDQVLPMDIMSEYLIKAIIAGDIDKMEALGIYEIAPEDFALAEFVDSSKLEIQRIVREGLDMLRKENA